MPRGLWPVDWLMLGYLAAIAALVAVFREQIPDAGALLAVHGIAALAIATYAYDPSLPGASLFRHWYPLPYVGAGYREMSILIGSIRRANFDAQLADWDFAIWGAHPAVWMERIQLPALTEFLQIAYSLFVPGLLALALVLWLRSDMTRFRGYAFLLSLGFLASYLGYLIVPARGPRIFLAAMFATPLDGLWLAAPLRRILDLLESAHYDCFPSGHVEMTVLAWWASRKISRTLAWVYGTYAVLTLLATVYLRYHYSVDLLAGLAAAGAIIVVAPHLEATARADGADH